jgi:hypothetical protein
MKTSTITLIVIALILLGCWRMGLFKLSQVRADYLCARINRCKWYHYTTTVEHSTGTTTPGAPTYYFGSSCNPQQMLQAATR